MVLLQLSGHLENNNLFFLHQFAYRSRHSTETALLKMGNDLLTALDDSRVSLLSLLNFSTAFYSIDHETLLSRLHHAFDISDTALSLTHLGCFCQRNLSFPICVEIWSTSGFSVWPYSLCVLYPTTLRHCTPSLLSHHGFSDDNRLYKSGHISQLKDIIQSTKCCFTD